MGILDPLNIVVSRIVAAGVPCTVAAGNGGADGPFNTFSPADAESVTSIASFDNRVYPKILVPGQYFISGEPTGIEFGWNPSIIQNISMGLYPLQATTSNISNTRDLCQKTPFNLHGSQADLSRQVVLIRSGGCSINEKVSNAVALGAKHVLLCSNEPHTGTEGASIPGMQSVGIVSVAQAEEWVRLMRSGAQVSLHITPPEEAGLALMDETNTQTGGLVSSFTSWGPTPEVGIKPQVAAPGGMIASTFPINMGGYAVLSGTSMACPFVAGSVALLLEARGTLSPKYINTLFVSTATPAASHNGGRRQSYLAPVAQQGAGLLNAYNAVHSTTLVDSDGFTFNDENTRPISTGFRLFNTGPVEVTYHITHVPSSTFYAFNEGGLTQASSPTMLRQNAQAQLSFNTRNITIPAGEHAYINLHAVAPISAHISGSSRFGNNNSTVLDANRIPVFSGYISIRRALGSSFYSQLSDSKIQIPYLGVAASMKTDAHVMDMSHVYLMSSSRSTSRSKVTSFTLSQPDTIQKKNPKSTAPTVFAKMVLGSPLVRVDVQPAGVDSGRGKYRYVGGEKVPLTKHVLGHNIIGSMTGYPAAFIPGVPLVESWTGELSDGSYAPERNYTFLIRALRVFGDEDKEEDYEVARTEYFSISYS